MKKINVLSTVVILSAFFSFLPANSSTLPPADLDSVSIGVGLFSPGISIDVPVSPRIITGISAALPIFYPDKLFGTLRYTLYGGYQIIKEPESNLSFAAIIGIWGDRNFTVPNYVNTIFALQLGFAVAYRFTDYLNTRINIVAALPASEYGIIAPAAGFELVYTPTKNIELSVGLNGQGDFLGARWKF